MVLYNKRPVNAEYWNRSFMSRLCMLFQQHANCFSAQRSSSGDCRDRQKKTKKQRNDIWSAVEGDRDRAILCTECGSDKHSGHFKQHSEHLGQQLASCSSIPIMSDWRHCMSGWIALHQFNYLADPLCADCCVLWGKCTGCIWYGRVV